MSDHISGPRALSNPIADITDVYAFPSPEKSGCLVLVLNTMPMAKPSDLFSDGLLYRFRLRPLHPPSPNDAGWGFVPGEEEIVVDCVFATPDAGAGQQQGTCVSPSGEPIPFLVNDSEGGSGPWRASLRWHTLGSVHHGCPRRLGDDRDPGASRRRVLMLVVAARIATTIPTTNSALCGLRISDVPQSRWGQMRRLGPANDVRETPSINESIEPRAATTALDPLLRRSCRRSSRAPRAVRRRPRWTSGKDPPSGE
ncbi:DUF4331 domain-containing protein [Rhodococcus sp. ARC_M6]|nr:DUF4331 family protein [Rhodococcus sp. ARC_M6]MCJ0905671.1 DUF4331 domain-containing protein [Rhodococcus sp. ARC_M6]